MEYLIKERLAKPRIFIISTYYDLKNLRANLERFIKELGYDPVLNEKDNNLITQITN